MIEWSKLTDPEIDALDRNLPVILPIGLIEAHGAHLESGFDAYSADYIARRPCARATGAILLPPIPYGFADTNWEYVSTLGVKAETLGMMIGDHVRAAMPSRVPKDHRAVRSRCERCRRHAGISAGVGDLSRYAAAHWCYFVTGGVPMSHADEKETALALAIGATVHMDRAEDFILKKPWHEAHSRKSLAPRSGGMNGHATRATHAMGDDILRRVMAVLIEKLTAIMAEARV